MTDWPLADDVTLDGGSGDVVVVIDVEVGTD